MLADEGRPVVRVNFVRYPSIRYSLSQGVQKSLQPLVRVKLAMDDQPRTVVDQGKEEGALRRTPFRLERWSVHAVRHPQQIRQRQFKGLGGPAGQGRTG